MSAKSLEQFQAEYVAAAALFRASSLALVQASGVVAGDIIVEGPGRDVSRLVRELPELTIQASSAAFGLWDAARCKRLFLVGDLERLERITGRRNGGVR